uniref:Root cap protein 1-like n=1 Tax=Oryza sativa subsp. japonica TaxID=39947 RepID=Q5VML1_ORYSJ|nr:root cap protein 1-like [Oryza sativa Japonica Group]BAD69314.1 root cap protein 1-like [Oryza sativa Japonica Group]
MPPNLAEARSGPPPLPPPPGCSCLHTAGSGGGEARPAFHDVRHHHHCRTSPPCTERERKRRRRRLSCPRRTTAASMPPDLAEARSGPPPLPLPPGRSRLHAAVVRGEGAAPLVVGEGAAAAARGKRGAVAAARGRGGEGGDVRWEGGKWARVSAAEEKEGFCFPDIDARPSDQNPKDRTIGVVQAEISPRGIESEATFLAQAHVVAWGGEVHLRDPRCLLYPPPPSPLLADVCSALASCSLVPPSSLPLQPCAAIAPVVAVAREGRRRGRRSVVFLVRPSAVAVDRRTTAVVVKPKVAAASSSTPSSSVDLPPPFWSSEKILKSSKASKASHTDPKQPFEHVDPI